MKEGIQRVGKCIGLLANLMDAFDIKTSVTSNSSVHKLANFDKDRDKIIQQFTESLVLKKIEKQQHSAFPNFTANMTQKMNRKSFDS